MLRPFLNTNTLTLILVAVIGILAVLNLINTKRFSSYLTLFINPSYISIYGKDVKLFDKFNFLLFVAFTLSVTVFISALNFRFNFFENSDWFIILINVVLFFGLKIVTELILGKLLDSFYLFKIILFRKLSYSYFLTFIITPLSALFLYNTFIPNNVVESGLIFLLILYVISYLIVLRFYLGFAKQHLFYFILYICTLEIAPCLIIYKFVL